LPAPGQQALAEHASHNDLLVRPPMAGQFTCDRRIQDAVLDLDRVTPGLLKSEQSVVNSIGGCTNSLNNLGRSQVLQVVDSLRIAEPPFVSAMHQDRVYSSGP
jgi:stage III sporulation protein SpoIIIAA